LISVSSVMSSRVKRRISIQISKIDGLK
jgi:hypothetical protein